MRYPLALLLFFTIAGFCQHPSVEHVIVHKEAGRYGGWPANHGIWSWGNEILVGFELGYFKDNQRGHSIDYDKPAEHVLARSMDGGKTWKLERPEGLRPPASIKIAGVPAGAGGKEPVDCEGGLDFSNPDFVFTARMANIHIGPSRFYYSNDRGRTWSGPCKLPNFGQHGIAARTDYIITGKHEMIVFLTAAKSNEKEGRVIAVKTTDGARTWKMLSFVGPEPEGNDFAIMPASVSLGGGKILTAIRHRRFIDLWGSEDGGVTWKHVTTPVPDSGRGNPASLSRLKDGRLVLVYGYRAEPYGIRARISKDNGKTWSDDIILRADAGGWDLGYPRSVVRPDGKVVSIYYYNDSVDTERYIGATIWQP
jgi:Neuraminidase (sialidase)